MTTMVTDQRASRRWRPSTVDVALALVVLVVEIGVTLVASSHQDTRRGFDALAALLLASGALALVWRRRHPLVVLGVALATTLTYVVIGFP